MPHRMEELRQYDIPEDDESFVRFGVARLFRFLQALKIKRNGGEVQQR